MWTADEKLEADVKKLQSDLGLTDEQMEKLKELALQEHQQVVKTKHHKNTAVFNQNVNEIFAGIDKEVKVLLGKSTMNSANGSKRGGKMRKHIA